MSPAGYGTMPDGTENLKVPQLHWDTLAALDSDDVCRRSRAAKDPEYGYRLLFLNREVIVDTKNRSLWATENNGMKKIDDPLLALIILVYLQNAVDIEPENIMAAAKELKEGHFFTGLHALDVDGVIAAFGHDLEGFAAAAEALGGTRETYGDMSYKLYPLPRIPLYYLLWEGDDDFSPNLTVCFDRSIERHFAADAIWGLVKRVSRALVDGSAIRD